MSPSDCGPLSLEFLQAQGVPMRRVSAGETLFLEGDDGHTLYVVIDGRIDVKVGGMIVDNVGPQGVVGEMALIDQDARSATAVARLDTHVAEIDRDTFLALVSQYPSFALYVMKLMAGRIRRMNTNT
jgi:CRP-like cAMP-binding protein